MTRNEGERERALTSLYCCVKGVDALHPDPKYMVSDQRTADMLVWMYCLPSMDLPIS